MRSEGASPLAGDATAGERSFAGVLRPGRNIWRRERAERAAMLVDAGPCFGAMREAMRKARSSIAIVGWDIDSRTPLVGNAGEPDDGLPATLGPFLTALVERNPDLSVKLLLWDYSVLYALEREPMPNLALGWNTPRQIELCLDGTAPVASSHHQKIVVIDDAVAFAGGLDLTIRRWDTPGHAPVNSRRIDPAGAPYPPFHDVQMIVDGDAAAALGDMVRARWLRSACEELPPTPRVNDPWPESVDPDFRDVDIGIARTLPAFGGDEGVREIEALYLDMIDAAEETIYLENQFLTCGDIADRLAARLRARPELEALIVAPRTHHTWIEHRTMLAGRIRFLQTLREAGVADRVHLVHPHVEHAGDAADVMVHAKVTIVDDKILRIGSANIANRSMGTDSECDLVLEAASADERAGIVRLRNRLLAEHCGREPEEIGDALVRHGSLIAAVNALNGHEGNRQGASPDGTTRQLRMIRDGTLDTEEAMSTIEALADPRKPIEAPILADFAGEPLQPHRLSTFLKMALAAIAVLVLVGAWRWTPLVEWTKPEAIEASLNTVAASPWGPAIVILIFVLAGLLAFPVTLLIAGTAAAFGTWSGLAYATAGSLASAMASYAIGRRFGQDGLRSIMGPRINRIGQGIKSQGVFAVATVRLMPIAPFLLVNLVAGAMRIRLLDYVIGTLLGLAPGLVLMSALGHQVLRVITQPSLSDIAMLVGFLFAWFGLSLGLQRFISRTRGRLS